MGKDVSKDTIIRLAKELQEGDIKNENTLRNIIGEISELTGKEVSKEKEDKIVNMVISDKVPKDIENMFKLKTLNLKLSVFLCDRILF